MLVHRASLPEVALTTGAVSHCGSPGVEALRVQPAPLALNVNQESLVQLAASMATSQLIAIG